MTRDELATLGAIGIGLSPFAIAFGIAGVAAGLSTTTTMVMTIGIYAGASQFSAIAVLAAGGTPLLAIVTVWLVNLRFLPLALSMPPTITRTWPQRALGAHLLVDPMLALVYASPPERRSRVFWNSAFVIWLIWVGGTAIGAVAGTRIPDPGLLGLDAALPCVFIGLLASWCRDPSVRRATVGGAGVATAAFMAGAGTFAVPASVLGALAGLFGRRSADAVSAPDEHSDPRDRTLPPEPGDERP